MEFWFRFFYFTFVGYIQYLREYEINVEILAFTP